MTSFTIRRSLAALAFVATGAGAALAQGTSSPILNTIEVRQLVASSVPADQAKLAAHFTALADRHDADARRHRAMGQAYVPGPRGQGLEMRTHCRRLAELGAQAAVTLRALATHHASLAGGAASSAPVAGIKYQAGADAREPSEADLTALAGRASTTAEHTILRDYFLAFARRYDEEADGHAGMATLYRTTSRLAPVAAHCDRLVTELRGIAAEARSAAAMHRLLAGDLVTK
jgi:hypothetical protein